MNCEIEFLAVGKASCAGDAIIVRYGTPQAFKLMLVDGGPAPAGERIVSHLKRHFGAYVELEHVVLTHSDIDHASGLRTVLRELPVRNLWLHIPWELAKDSRHLFRNKTMTADALMRRVRSEYDIVAEIVDIAELADCKLDYPFAGKTIGPFLVCSPTAYAYRHLLPQFDETPEPDRAAIEAARMWLGKESLLRRIFEQARKATEYWIEESWTEERLRDVGQASASDESSVILYGDFGDRRALLTGDAGVNALGWAADYAEARGLPLQSFSFVQVPNHGGRRNVGPAILDRILGPVQARDDPARFSAYVSAPAGDPRFPRKMVANAFKRRGGLIIATQGEDRIHYGGFPRRQGYRNVDPLPFFDRVEDYA